MTELHWLHIRDGIQPHIRGWDEEINRFTHWMFSAIISMEKIPWKAVSGSIHHLPRYRPENGFDLVLNLYLHHCKHSSPAWKVATECPVLKFCLPNIKNTTKIIIFVSVPCQPGQRSFPTISAGIIFCWISPCCGILWLFLTLYQIPLLLLPLWSSFCLYLPPLCSALLRNTWNITAHSRLQSSGKTRSCWRSSSGGHREDLGSGASLMRRDCRSWPWLSWRREGWEGIPPIHVNIPKECPEDGARLFSVGPATGWGATAIN